MPHSSIDVSAMDVETLRELRSKIDAIIDGPGDKLGTLDEAVAELKAVKEKVAATGRAAVTKALKGFMANHPEVASLRWTQYTPYFNDGDSCEFSVNEAGVRLAGDPAATDVDEDEDDEDEGEYREAWDLEYYAKKEESPIPTALIADLKSINGLLEHAEDALRATFGDHARITVGRDGEAEVEEYEHD